MSKDERSYHVDGVFGVFVMSVLSMVGFGVFWFGATMFIDSVTDYSGVTSVIISSLLVFSTTMGAIGVECFAAKATRHLVYSLIRFFVVFMAFGVKAQLQISVPYVALTLVIVFMYHLGANGKIVLDKGQYMA